MLGADSFLDFWRLLVSNIEEDVIGTYIIMQGISSARSLSLFLILDIILVKAPVNSIASRLPSTF